MQVAELWRELSADIIALSATFRARLPTLAISTKPDRTLLTDADTAVQDLIVQKIRSVDPDSPLIAEEDVLGAHRRGSGSQYCWIADPIDGTAQFVEPSAIEFCSVVALYERGQPLAALVVAPEFGNGRTPLVVSIAGHDSGIDVNGTHIPAGPRTMTGYASTTRSKGCPPDSRNCGTAPPDSAWPRPPA